MDFEIQKLPSGFFAVWIVLDGRKTLWDASTITMEQAVKKADEAKKVCKGRPPRNKPSGHLSVKK